MLQLPIHNWAALSAEERLAALRRPAQSSSATLQAQVAAIVADVRARGDAALIEYTSKYDGVQLSALKVTAAEFEAAERTLNASQHAALQRAIGNVRRFHEAQRSPPLQIETSPGVVCERHFIPLEAVGLYVPAGTAPLPSAAIMLAVPASIAGCDRRVLCTPPRRDGAADPAVLVAAKACGVTDVFKAGGAQAVAAMAYGTASIPKVDKIFGPGNAWVTAAKLLVSNDPHGAALDLPAGPSEVLVIADDGANAEFVASDLLAQAEHSVDAQAILVALSQSFAQKVIVELERQLQTLSRVQTLAEAIRNTRIFVAGSLDDALALSNAYAPEHLILQIDEPRSALPKVRHAGSVFLGQWTPETMGDYCSGTNHVLPTYGFARAYSGLSLIDFMKRMTVQELSAAGLRDLGPTAIQIAELEGLDAHANAVVRRLRALESRSS
ncbi:MAG TPA: histidinol dehydrogenase [Steroidobacteraceae bacterium]|nr:histidinol dehydrogenase [Steroidobacteraceae bacterium]